MKQSRLARRVYEIQRDLANRGMECWALSIKRTLQHLGYPTIWDQQDYLVMSKAKLKQLLVKRINDQCLASQREKAKQMKSCKEYIQEIHTGGLDKRLENYNFEGRRKYARLMLRSEWGIMTTDAGGGRSCTECGEIFVNNIFIHRIIDCKYFDKIRNNLKERNHIEKITALPENEQLEFLQRFFFEYLVFL